MSQATEAARIIRTLEERGFYAECPCCSEPIRLKDAGLFFLDEMTPEAQLVYEQRLAELKERAQALKHRRRAITQKSEVGAKAVNIGFILERLAPSMEAFRFEHNDCRSLFDPIDYLIFEGLSAKGIVSRLFFADIKTGKARLQDNQKAIKGLVEAKKVEFDVYETET